MLPTQNWYIPKWCLWNLIKTVKDLKKTSEKTEGKFKNGQCREKATMGKRYRTKQHETKKMNNTDLTKTIGDDSRCSRSISSSCFSQYIYRVNHSQIRYCGKKKNLVSREMIHYHLRNGYFVTINKFVMTTTSFL